MGSSLFPSSIHASTRHSKRLRTCTSATWISSCCYSYRVRAQHVHVCVEGGVVQKQPFYSWITFFDGLLPLPTTVHTKPTTHSPTCAFIQLMLYQPPRPFCAKPPESHEPVVSLPLLVGVWAEHRRWLVRVVLLFFIPISLICAHVRYGRKIR